MKEKLKLLQEALGFSGREFSLRIGKSNGYIRSNFKNPSIEIVVNVLRAFPQVNIYWLVLGVGPMFIPIDKENQCSEEATQYFKENSLSLIEEYLMFNKDLRAENNDLRAAMLDLMEKNEKLLAENAKLKAKLSIKPEK